MIVASDATQLDREGERVTEDHHKGAGDDEDCLHLCQEARDDTQLKPSDVVR